jgi:hypothetical protein
VEFGGARILAVGILAITAQWSSAAEAGRPWLGTAPVCEQLMHKARNAWTFNDRIAWSKHCHAETKEWIATGRDAPMMSDKARDAYLKKL